MADRKIRTSKQKGKWVRNKGLSFERAIANRLAAWRYPDAKRHLESQADEAAKGIDLSNTGKLGIQCKAYKNYAPLNKIEEVNIPDCYPTLITKGNNKKPIIAMYLDDFMKYVDGGDE